MCRCENGAGHRPALWSPDEAEPMLIWRRTREWALEPDEAQICSSALDGRQKPPENAAQLGRPVPRVPATLRKDDELRCPPDHGICQVAQMPRPAAEARGDVARDATIRITNSAQTEDRARPPWHLPGLEVHDQVSQHQRPAFSMKEHDFPVEPAIRKSLRDLTVPSLQGRITEFVIDPQLCALARRSGYDTRATPSDGGAELVLPWRDPRVVNPVRSDQVPHRSECSYVFPQGIFERDGGMNPDPAIVEAYDGHPRGERQAVEADPAAIDDSRRQARPASACIAARIPWGVPCV
jgi:hypothetical protein